MTAPVSPETMRNSAVNSPIQRWRVSPEGAHGGRQARSEVDAAAHDEGARRAHDQVVVVGEAPPAEAQYDLLSRLSTRARSVRARPLPMSIR